MEEHGFAIAMFLSGLMLGRLSTNFSQIGRWLAVSLLYNVHRLRATIAIVWESYFDDDNGESLTITYYKDGDAIYGTDTRQIDEQAPTLYDYLIVVTLVDGKTTESIREELPTDELATSEWRILGARCMRASQPGPTNVPSLSRYHHAEGDILLGKLWREHYMPGVKDITCFEIMDSSARVVSVGREQAIRVLDNSYEIIEE